MPSSLSAHTLQDVLPFSVVLPASATSALAARQVLSTALAGLVAADVLADALVMATELVTNAVVNAGTVSALSVSMPTREVLRVSVSDFDGSPISATTPDPLAENGRGLQLVTALAVRWGSDPTYPAGKTVWFEVDVAH